MISVVIATHESERALVATLAALVPGALAGLVAEVIVVDAASQDATAKVADVAGARFLVMPAPPGARLTAGAALARAKWLLFLRPGLVPDVTWVDETAGFVREAEHAPTPRPCAAVFRAAVSGSGSRRAVLAEALSLAAIALGARRYPGQGLLIPKLRYDALGGHAAEGTDPEADLLRRVGRRNIVMLRSAGTMVSV